MGKPRPSSQGAYPRAGKHARMSSCALSGSCVGGTWGGPRRAAAGAAAEGGG